MKNIRGPIIALILSLLMTYLIYEGALEATLGQDREFTGRRSGFANLFYGIGHDYGMAAVVLGMVACAASVFWLVRAIRGGGSKQ
ncbi:hypothetical protein [Meiothermus taiwanensis]|jgi:hypothetical protein|uniref:Uncharacterized protein n=2 Tax=Meiothermus taiwanensis TaxID=172827 RepID=A0A399E3U4_9DEIN|nr:hypothetical protein [Meiothermus taiwanensis]AWR87102.1 hypothetical protein Mtai_v1c18680 [Meiothermus taiwanensis WR-220]KIQ55162.1 hypothetical protein SY28_04990 [Meiothermus taiwanensis]KZK17083.1 hypothetical protein A3962_13410 [Meiothermus taiwanensis]RIH79165.1 hypothetical protein Mcate_00516 [Meiothermus taiwanensis]